MGGDCLFLTRITWDRKGQRHQRFIPTSPDVKHGRNDVRGVLEQGGKGNPITKVQNRANTYQPTLSEDRNG
jgi:hypothetical protein